MPVIASENIYDLVTGRKPPRKGETAKQVVVPKLPAGFNDARMTEQLKVLRSLNPLLPPKPR